MKNWKIESTGLIYNCDEDMVVYFDTASGDTHLISNFAAHLIELIVGQGRPIENSEIIELIAADIEPKDRIESAQAIPGILSELAELDIIVAC